MSEPAPSVNRHRQEQQAERFARYCELRDEGILPVDAGREIGLAAGAREAYERSYRRARKLPPRKQGLAW